MKTIDKLAITALILYAILIIVSAKDESETIKENLYKLLGVPKDATVKEIRKAFKTLAITLHPDKNQNDSAAHEKFIKLTHAYEILKDPETRKSYDIYGETGEFKGSSTQYRSYSYYANDFGIYDDDPLIVTLSKADYELNVLDTSQNWWVNFYSPQCHHCHTLAPVWRELAEELEGVVRLAAVNCEEDWVLCHQLQIGAYPTLLYYEKEAHLYEGEVYRGSNTFDQLKTFAFSRIKVSVREIQEENFEELFGNDWLLFLCGNFECPEKETQIKLAATLEGLLSVGIVRTKTLSEKIHKDSPIVLWQVQDDKNNVTSPILGSDSKEILNNVLNLLPNPNLLNEDDFKEIRSKLRTESVSPWLICFYLGPATELDLQLKRLPVLLPNINIGLVHCGKSSALCQSLHISHYPTWATIKLGGAFEKHHGRDVLHEVATFARDSVKSTNLHALSPADFLNLKDLKDENEGTAWFIDWFAPWCPPCRRLLPELRRASQHFPQDQCKFGSIDCTQHSELCAREGIRSYPTTKFYKANSVHNYHGVLNEENIVTFVNDMLNPLVINLDTENFIRLMRKPETELWFVQFYAPWCGHCQRLAPTWRLLAKQLQMVENVKIAEIDCVKNAELCSSQGVKGYPTLRLYPLKSKGLNAMVIYNGHREITALKNIVFEMLPSNVISLTAHKFKKIFTQSNENGGEPWLVDFYSPWCGHCVDFEPHYRIVAEKLENITKTAKLNCHQEQVFCRELNVFNYPTVILYLSADKWFQINSQEPHEIIKRVETLIGAQKLKHGSSHDEL